MKACICLSIQMTIQLKSILTREGTTGVPAGDAALGGTGGASGTFPATTAASHSASLSPNFFVVPETFWPSLALTTKRREGDFPAVRAILGLKFVGALRPTKFWLSKPFTGPTVMGALAKVEAIELLGNS